ncbi:MAG: hypothetical protein ACRDKT_04660 [Actinomycetota bacterium]
MEFLIGLLPAMLGAWGIIPLALVAAFAFGYWFVVLRKKDE